MGIYNYITQFMDIESESDENLSGNHFSQAMQKLDISAEKSDKQALENAKIMAQSYAYHHRHEFSVAKDYVHIRGEDNLFSYTKIKNCGFRVSDDDSLQDILGVILGANTADVPLSISYESHEQIALAKELCKAVGLNAEFAKESKEDFIAKMASFERIRYHAKADKSDPLYQAAAKEAKIIIREKPLLNGRFELLYYHNEKALSISYHRYGNLGIRALKH